MFNSSVIDPASEQDKLMSIGERLASTERWRPYCESLEDDALQAHTAILLENQLAHLSQIDEVTKTLAIGNFDKFAFPLIRAVYPNLIANEVVSVQPMAGPVSLVFYLDYIYGGGGTSGGAAKGNIASGTSAFDSLTGPTGNQDYTTNVIPSETPSFSGGDATLAYTPVIPGSVSLTYTNSGTTYTATDDGGGNFIGSDVSAGAIDYTTGAITNLQSTAIGGDVTAATITYRYDHEASDNIPQIDLNLTSAPVIAEQRKIRARYSMEAAQNLNALHGLDAEAELVGVMAEVVKQELDREIINDLRAFASAGSVTWNKAVPPGVSYTEHKLSFVDALIQAGNLVFTATKRAQTNWVIAGVKVCDIIESLPTFEPIAGALDTQSNTGVVKIGTLNGRWTVFKDPFLANNEWIQGFKGGSFLDTGYVYAPYIPLYATPTVILDDFLARKGIASQYGKKSVNARFYVTGTVLNA